MIDKLLDKLFRKKPTEPTVTRRKQPYSGHSAHAKILKARNPEDIEGAIETWLGTVTITTLDGVSVDYVPAHGVFVITVIGDWT